MLERGPQPTGGLRPILAVDRTARQERFHERISFAPPGPAHDRIGKRFSAGSTLGTGPRQFGRCTERAIFLDEPIEVGAGVVEALQSR